MHDTTSRTILLGASAGVIAGIATVATIIAVDTMRMEWVPETLDRLRMTPAERAELDAARRALAEQSARQHENRLKREAATRAKFHTDLLTGPRVGLAAMPLPQLITEILHVGARVREAWKTNPQTGLRDYERINRWTDQLAALRSEFDRRRNNPAPGQSLSRLDRARWQAAYRLVHSYDESDLPDFATSITPTTTEQP